VVISEASIHLSVNMSYSLTAPQADGIVRAQKGGIIIDTTYFENRAMLQVESLWWAE
jgi:hypothetical protein